MDYVIPILHWLSGLIVMAEALNKLERTTPFAPGLDCRQRVVDGLKSVAWTLLALGAGGALVTPIFGELGIHSIKTQLVFHQTPSLAETLFMLGFATLIIRTRVKEG